MILKLIVGWGELVNPNKEWSVLCWGSFLTPTYHAIEKGERISASRLNRRERGIWQRRFWVHLVTDQEDYNRHIDYIHWNPVKYGLVNRVNDWPHSSFHQFVEQGVYPAAWGYSGSFEIEGGE